MVGISKLHSTIPSNIKKDGKSYASPSIPQLLSDKKKQEERENPSNQRIQRAILFWAVSFRERVGCLWNSDFRKRESFSFWKRLFVSWNRNIVFDIPRQVLPSGSKFISFLGLP